MTWFRLDDEFAFHEKAAALAEGPCRADAIALWTFSACWAARAMKSGFVARGVTITFGFHPEAASELVRVGLWEAVEGGYQFHDWADYNPTGERIEEKKRLAVARKAKHRAKLAAAQAPAQESVPEEQSQAECQDVGQSRVTDAVGTLESRTENAVAALGDRERASDSLSSDLGSCSEGLSRARTEPASSVPRIGRETLYRIPLPPTPPELATEQTRSLAPTPLARMVQAADQAYRDGYAQKWASDPGDLDPDTCKRFGLQCLAAGKLMFDQTGIRYEPVSLMRAAAFAFHQSRKGQIPPRMRYITEENVVTRCLTVLSVNNPDEFQPVVLSDSRKAAAE